MARQRKNKKNKTYKKDVHQLYLDGCLLSRDFYEGAMYLIKKYLTKQLIQKGYYKNGIKQTNLDMEDYDDCYCYILGKIKEKYDPERAHIATFIRNWITGYCTVTVQPSARKYNKYGADLPLDIDKDLGISEEFRDSFSYQDIEDGLDDELYNDGLLDDLTSTDIREFRERLKEYESSEL